MMYYVAKQATYKTIATSVSRRPKGGYQPPSTNLNRRTQITHSFHYAICVTTTTNFLEVNSASPPLPLSPLSYHHHNLHCTIFYATIVASPMIMSPFHHSSNASLLYLTSLCCNFCIPFRVLLIFSLVSRMYQNMTVKVLVFRIIDRGALSILSLCGFSWTHKGPSTLKSVSLSHDFSCRNEYL